MNLSGTWPLFKGATQEHLLLRHHGEVMNLAFVTNFIYFLSHMELEDVSHEHRRCIDREGAPHELRHSKDEPTFTRKGRGVPY